MVEISQVLMYLLFSFLLGVALLQVVPKNRGPAFVVKNSWVYGCICLIPVLSVIPILSATYQIHIQYEAPFMPIMTQVMLGYKIGQAWMVTTLLAIISITLYYGLVYIKTFYVKLIFLLLVIIFALSSSWASHAASLDEGLGFIYNGLHFIAATVWMGTLFVISWFSSEKSTEKWTLFIRWFSPVAIASVIILILSGLLLMTIIVPEYVNSWVLTYGQLLLLKHILIAPIILFGVVHGFLLRKRLHKVGVTRFQNTLKAESIIGLFIFGITAVMTERVPPHEVARTLQTTEPSLLYKWFIGEHVGSIVPLTFSFNWLSIVLFTGSALLLLLLIFEVLRGKGWIRIISVSTAFAFLMLFGILGSTHPSSQGWIDSQRFSTPREAIQSSQENGEVEVLVEQRVSNDFIAVVYHINHEKLAVDLLYKDNQDYYKVNESNLMIGGIPINELDHKIRTFIIRNGPWLQNNQPYTYVTIGYISEPSDVDKVGIYFEGDSSEAKVENNTFINVISSDEEWDPNHPIEFFNDKEEIVGGYMRGFLEEGVYCH
ncbi:copper resistance D family protein [Alkalihalobacillus sp. BA299]|uniref:copper resistance D family protein n=1 Tax=Alkalihalobacillus sp. BA299 TaxID=2815938 RepID=UPI001AD98B02|nr:CopD family protein [Alkalihalobacillus sp. BA299]